MSATNLQMVKEGKAAVDREEQRARVMEERAAEEGKRAAALKGELSALWALIPEKEQETKGRGAK